jgi:hypothetical protein
MASKYGYQNARPAHLSVGALLVNVEGKIAVQHIKQAVMSETGETVRDVVTLMRTTLQDNESLEDAVIRGVMREFGATGVISKYLGGITTRIPLKDDAALKTTLYFLVQCMDMNFSQRSVRSDEYESQAVLVWYDPDALIEKMTSQSEGLAREDFDESDIVRRFLGIHGS